MSSPVLPKLLSDRPVTPRFWAATLGAGLALAAAAALSAQQPWPATAAFVLFSLASPVLAAVDWRERRLPDLITVPLAVLCLLGFLLASALTGDWARVGVAVGCAAAAAAFFFVLFLIAPSQLGFGDVKLMLSVGLVLGWHGLVATAGGVTLGLLIGLAFGGALIVMKRATRRSHVALGPHLLAGTLILSFLLY